MKSTTIAGFAREGGVSIETVRYYQRRGLLETPQRAGTSGHGAGIHHYGEADIRHLRFIRAAQTAGFTLDAIGELLALNACDDRTRARQLAAERLAALDDRIAELTMARDALTKLVHDCDAQSAGPCPIITAFDRS